MNQIHEHVEKHNQEHIDQLIELLKIPSVSTKSENNNDVRQCAETLRGHLEAIGLDAVQLFETPGNPIVYGEWLKAPGKPTVLIYGHYDVQPPEPLDQWTSPPFEPTLRDGELFARGVADDKGKLFVHLKAIEAHLSTSQALPVNVKVLLEGEEEIGSPSLYPFIEQHCEQLACDTVLISDTALVERGKPTITYSTRGIAYMEINVAGPDFDLHSGSFGGNICNPANALIEIISKLKDDKEVVQIPGFYDDIRQVSDDERTLLNKVPVTDQTIKERTGVDALAGEEGWTPVERLAIRPTLDVNGFLSGYTGEGSKTIIPATAMAKVSMRLVPNQDPTDIEQKFSDYVSSIAPEGVSVSIKAVHSMKPQVSDPQHPIMQAAARACERAYGMEPFFAGEGGSIPTSVFAEKLGAVVVLMGVGAPDEAIHSPNEKLDLKHFFLGTLSSAYFFEELSQLS